MLEKLDFKKLNQLYNETSRHLELLNLKVSLENDVNTPNLLNVALENVLFMFRKVSEEEMVIADQLKDTLRKTREALKSNFDPHHDAEFISLQDELKRVFKGKNLDEITQDEMKQNIMALQTIFEKVTELNRKNNLLKAKYGNDARYARVHKRIMEKGSVSKRESEIADVLLDIKAQADDKILVNRRLLDNEGYFQGLMMNIVFDSFGKTKIELDTESALYINRCVVKEYMNEYQGSR